MVDEETRVAGSASPPHGPSLLDSTGVIDSKKK